MAFSDILQANLGLAAQAGTSLGESVSEGLFGATGGQLGAQSQTTIDKIKSQKVAGIQADMMQAIKTGTGDPLEIMRNAALRLQVIGDAEGSKALADMINQQALRQQAAANAAETKRANEEREAQDIVEEEGRITRAAETNQRLIDTAAAENKRLTEAAKDKAVKDAVKKQADLQKKRPSETEVADNVMKLLNRAEGLQGLLDSSGNLPEGVKFDKANGDSLQLFYKEAFLSGVPEADIQDAIQKSLGFIDDGKEGSLLGLIPFTDTKFFDTDTITFDIEAAKVLIAGLGTDSGVEEQLGAE